MLAAGFPKLGRVMGLEAQAGREGTNSWLAHLSWARAGDDSEGWKGYDRVAQIGLGVAEGIATVFAGKQVRYTIPKLGR